jgi:hypothetical protein
VDILDLHIGEPYGFRAEVPVTACLPLLCLRSIRDPVIPRCVYHTTNLFIYIQKQELLIFMNTSTSVTRYRGRLPNIPLLSGAQPDLPIAKRWHMHYGDTPRKPVFLGRSVSWKTVHWRTVRRRRRRRQHPPEHEETITPGHTHTAPRSSKMGRVCAA